MFGALRTERMLQHLQVPRPLPQPSVRSLIAVRPGLQEGLLPTPELG